jgi:hypothetical protein
MPGFTSRGAIQHLCPAASSAAASPCAIAAPSRVEWLMKRWARKIPHFLDLKWQNRNLRKN